MRKAPSIASLTAALSLVVLVPSAAATLRSPALTSSCADGFTYEELTAGPWRVEGCHREGRPQAGEQRRERFRGRVELNGLIIEGSSELIVATSSTVARGAIAGPGETLEHTVTRENGTIVLDPLIGGERKRFVLSSGPISYTANTVGDATAETETEIGIPVGSSAKVLGMRVRERLRDVRVVRGGSGQQGGMVMNLPLSLGSGASSLLRDWTTRSRVELRDGQGMQVSDLRFAIGDIVIPGIGGFKDFSIEYGASRNEWSGATTLDLGDVLPRMAFDVSVSAETGIPTRIAATVSGLALPIGSTSIILREVRGSFQQNPLIFGAGLTATAGPQIGVTPLLELSGDLEIKLEPTFRLEIDGSARVLPTGPNDEIARGTSSIVLDSGGYIAIAADVRVQVRVLGIGAGATARGSGAYAWNRDLFNIEAGMTGTIYAGFLGDFDIVRLEAVVSSAGWGTCGELASFIRAGVGQEWGRKPKVFLSCDLSDFTTQVRGAAAGDRQTFRVPAGARKVGVLITGAGPEPRAAVVGPGGSPIVTTAPLGRRTIGTTASVIAQPGQAQQLVVLNRPKPGLWRVRAGARGPGISDVKIARDLEPIRADVGVRRVTGKPGLRRLAIRRLRGLGRGESVTIGIKTPRGIVPVGAVRGGAVPDSFAEVEPGTREIVAIVRRNGVPNPARTRVIGRYRARLPGKPGSVLVKRRKTSVLALAKPAPGGEAPQAWQYVVISGGRPIAAARARPGRPVRLTLPAGTGRVSVVARPVLRGRPLAGAVSRSASA